MGKARNLANLANSIGALASKNTVAAATDVTGLGSLALLNSVAAANVSGLGALAVLNSVGTAQIADDAVTAVKLGTAEKRRLPRAFGVFNGANGALLDGVGLTCTRTNTGLYTLTLDAAAPDTNYSVFVQAADTTNVSVEESTASSRTTTVFYVNGRNTSTNTAVDVTRLSVMVMY